MGSKMSSIDVTDLRVCCWQDREGRGHISNGWIRESYLHRVQVIGGWLRYLQPSIRSVHPNTKAKCTAEPIARWAVATGNFKRQWQECVSSFRHCGTCIRPWPAVAAVDDNGTDSAGQLESGRYALGAGSNSRLNGERVETDWRCPLGTAVCHSKRDWEWCHCGGGAAAGMGRDGRWIWSSPSGFPFSSYVAYAKRERRPQPRRSRAQTTR